MSKILRELGPAAPLVKVKCGHTVANTEVCYVCGKCDCCCDCIKDICDQCGQPFVVVDGPFCLGCRCIKRGEVMIDDISAEIEQVAAEIEALKSLLDKCDPEDLHYPNLDIMELHALEAYMHDLQNGVFE